MELARRVLVVTLLLAAVALTGCHGWGMEGHQLTARLAQDLIEPNAMRKIAALIGDVGLDSVSTWADTFARKWEWTHKLHYINVPNDSKDIDLARDCPDNACVVGAVTNYTSILLKNETKAEDRLDAVRFLVHFLGDIHQPLHAGYGSDQGGNLVHVTFAGHSQNLHHLWDVSLLEKKSKVLGGYDGIYAALADQIKKTDPNVIANLKSCKRQPSPICPLDWAVESYDVVVKQVYKGVTSGGHLGDDYYNNNIDVLITRLVDSAVRMANVLNHVFA